MSIASTCCLRYLYQSKIPKICFRE
ncbi:cyclic lactone autoinducer peptide [Pseudomonas entomophila]|nr:cyclic lactone autoinducer peptide [Pseudomonas entomophila]